MTEKVRRIRLLVAVGVAGLLAFVAAWPTQGAVADTPPPLYLARERAVDGATTGARDYLAVGDAPRLAAHVLADGENLAELQVIDSEGRVVVLGPNGQVAATGEVVEPGDMQSWLEENFRNQWATLDYLLKRNSVDPACASARQSARDWLNLPAQQGGGRLTLAETLAVANLRLVALHQPENQIPPDCFASRGRNPGHRAGYLHNLWHRITGTSGNNN